MESSYSPMCTFKSPEDETGGPAIDFHAAAKASASKFIDDMEGYLPQGLEVFIGEIKEYVTKARERSKQAAALAQSNYERTFEAITKNYGQ